MATDPVQNGLTSLPSVDDLPQTRGGGYDTGSVREAFDAFRRHVLQLQAQLRVVQAAGRSSTAEAPGHAVRMDALHVIRAAAEFADVIERDAQKASAAQLQRTEAEITRGQRDLQDEERRVERFREESERMRDEIMKNAKNEARELLGTANRDATAEVREAEARGARLLEQARHQATELTNAVRAEVDQTLEWARAEAAAILARAQEGAEQLLTAAGLGSDKLTATSDAIVAAANATVTESHGPAPTLVEAPEAPEPESEDEPEDEPEALPAPEQDEDSN
jgi:F0F1-type ATP synthase membrane subunit b/b'